MERQYLLQNDSSEITIEVSVSTVGIVSTDVSRKFKNSTFKTIIRSVDPPHSNGKGKISETEVDKANVLIGGELDVFTLVRLDHIPQNQWPAIFDSFMVTCTLRGGSQGEKIFKLTPADKEKTTSGKTFSGSFRISLL